MNEQKEKWMKEVLGSLDGVERADANPFLFEKISHRLRSEQQFTPRLPVWRFAIAFVLLVMLNLVTIKTYRTTKTVQSNNTDNSYQLNTGYNY